MTERGKAELEEKFQCQVNFIRIFTDKDVEDKASKLAQQAANRSNANPRKGKGKLFF